jgi:hypothetical protein
MPLTRVAKLAEALSSRSESEYDLMPCEQNAKRVHWQVGRSPMKNRVAIRISALDAVLFLVPEATSAVAQEAASISPQ